MVDVIIAQAGKLDDSQQGWPRSSLRRADLGCSFSRDPEPRGVGYPLQPSSLMAQPAFQILVIWLILPSSNSIT